MCDSLHFGFEGGMWDLIFIVTDHCLCFTLQPTNDMILDAPGHKSMSYNLKI